MIRSPGGSRFAAVRDAFEATVAAHPQELHKVHRVYRAAADDPTRVATTARSLTRLKTGTRVLDSEELCWRRPKVVLAPAGSEWLVAPCARGCCVWAKERPRHDVVRPPRVHPVGGGSAPSRAIL